MALHHEDLLEAYYALLAKAERFQMSGDSPRAEQLDAVAQRFSNAIEQDSQ